jgi:N-acetylglucosamine-6-phosphate deacetylase
VEQGNILTPDGWVVGALRCDDEGRVSRIDGAPGDPASNDLPYILPGFIDLHVHGGGGADCMEGAAAAVTTARTHARFGTTSMLATTMTAPRDELLSVLAALGDECRERRPGSARLLGVHLEGPYINPGKLGAQPNAAVTAALDEVLEYMALAPIRVVTLAPEIAGHGRIVAALAGRGVCVQIGHTLGSYEDGVAAMSALHHREPGIVGAALAHAEYAELIPDLLHVHPGAMRAAMRAIPRLYCVTDSTAAAGMPDGMYRLGSQAVTKCLGGVRLADGTLAGSTLTTDQAMRNLASIGLPLPDVVDRLSRFPAEYLGLADRGRLVPGAWADFNVFDRDLALVATCVEGEAIVEDARRSAGVA